MFFYAKYVVFPWPHSSLSLSARIPSAFLFLFGHSPLSDCSDLFWSFVDFDHHLPEDPFYFSTVERVIPYLLVRDPYLSFSEERSPPPMAVAAHLFLRCLFATLCDSGNRSIFPFPEGVFSWIGCLSCSVAPQTNLLLMRFPRLRCSFFFPFSFSQPSSSPQRPFIRLATKLSQCTVRCFSLSDPPSDL